MVSFPYQHVYPEQYEYMRELKWILDSDVRLEINGFQGHAILEMPTGTGKTVCLLSLILSYIKMKKPNFKLVYCTRTIVEMEKTLEELKFVLAQREKDFQDDDESLRSPLLAMCLSSRKNLCINERVAQFDDRERVDSACRSLTASWVREKVLEKQGGASYAGKGAAGKGGPKMMSMHGPEAVDIEDLGELCSFYEGFMGRPDSF